MKNGISKFLHETTYVLTGKALKLITVQHLAVKKRQISVNVLWGQKEHYNLNMRIWQIMLLKQLNFMVLFSEDGEEITILRKRYWQH